MPVEPITFDLGSVRVKCAWCDKDEQAGFNADMRVVMPDGWNIYQFWGREMRSLTVLACSRGCSEAAHARLLDVETDDHD